MKFLVDESAGRSIASYLSTLGHDVASVQEKNPGMEDAEVCEWANREERIRDQFVVASETSVRIRPLP